MPPPPSLSATAASDLVRPRRLALGYAGGVALGALASWLRVAADHTLRIDTHVPSFFVASMLLGIGLAIAGVCALRLIDVAEGVPRDRLLRWALLANLPVVLAAPLTSRDFYHYLASGRLQILGKNPFTVPPSALGAEPLLALVAPRWVDKATAYGPITNLFFRAAAATGAFVGAPLWGAAVTVKLMMAGCHLAFMVLAARYLRVHRPSPDGARTLALVSFSPLVAWEISGQAHNDGILIVALVLFVAAAIEGRELAAVLAIAAGTYAKITLAPLLALYLLFLLRWRGARAILYGLAALALGVALMLPFRHDFHGFGPTVTVIKESAVSHSVADFLKNVLAPFGPAVQARAVKATLYPCLGVCAVAFAGALRARTARELLRGALLFLLAWDMTIPLFQTWYVCWLFPFAVVETDRGWQRLIVLYGLWSALEWTVPIDPFTTMVVNGWVIWQVAKLLRAGASSPSPAAMGVEPVSRPERLAS